MDISELAPAGADMSRQVIGPHGRAVAQFTAHQATDPDSIWTPLSRTNDMTRDAPQGAPLGYQPGHALEHEPVDRAERDSQRTAQNVFDHVQAAGDIRAALRPGF
jgi:hypothetical protein